MASSLSNLVNNIAEGINKIKYKCGHDNETYKYVELHAKILSAALNIKLFKTI